MSQEFITRLLSTPESNAHADCMICLENYNTLNTATGIVEWEVRLPCGHGVGSSCIVTWLQANNSCPACRRTFFPSQPRPYLEHGIMEEEQSPAASVAVEPFSVSSNVDRIRIVVIVAESIARLLIQHLQTRYVRPMGAVSMYMASHLMRQPIDPEAVSRTCGVDLDRIRSLYTQIYSNRVNLLDPGILEHIADGHVEGMLAYLPSADFGDGRIDHNEERRERQLQTISPHLALDQTLHICNRYCMELGSSWLCLIARAIVREPLLEAYLGLRSPPLKAAVGLYMAAHLVGLQVSSRRIADLVSVNEDTFKTAYARVYPARDQLIKPSMFEYVGLENMQRALEAMPALNWPPL